MRKNILCLTLLLILSVLKINAQTTRADMILAELMNPESHKVLVVAHRGDWREWPENSLPAMQSAIDKGADIIELDLKMTKDSVLVVCHDAKIDRTTNGKGLVRDFTADSLASLVLKTGHGIKTNLKMPTLREALELCKNRVIVNIDKGYEYYDKALALCEELGVTGQVLIKGKAMPDDVARKFSTHSTNMLYMPIVEVLKERGRKLYKAYKDRAEVPLAYEVCWDTADNTVNDCIREMQESGAKIWVNSLWPSLNGGLCDDEAALSGNPDEIYGQLIAMGASIIQTDRISLLIDYLRSRGLHE